MRMPATKIKDNLQDELAALVDRWHFEAFHGSCVARDTEIWNLVHRAKEELKRRLATHVGEKRPA
jgi:hypothetical protein